MIRKLLATLVVTLVLVAPLRADLRYTAKMEMRASTTPSTAPVDPIMAMIGGMLTGMLVPAGGMEMTGVVGERGSRIEFSKAYLAIPAGAVTIVRPDGSMVVMNPVDKTYWKASATDASMPPGMVPVVTTKRTGEFSDIAGARSERIAFTIRIPLPLPEGTQAPPGMPTEIAMSGDLWTSDRFKASTNAAAMAMGLKSLGLDKVLSGGMPMRSIVRSPLFAGQELETVVTKIAEETVPASLFDVPTDYEEVPAPTGTGRVGGPGGGR